MYSVTFFILLFAVSVADCRLADSYNFRADRNGKNFLSQFIFLLELQENLAAIFNSMVSMHCLTKEL